MVCIYCGGDTRVTNSRHQKKANNIWRRRRCQLCHTVFTSVEAPDLTASIVVRKASKPVEPFSRDKLLLSLYNSLKHRQTALEDATALCDTIINKLVPESNRAALDVNVISGIAYSVLNRFDKAAATSYRAFHPV